MSTYFPFKASTKSNTGGYLRTIYIRLDLNKDTKDAASDYVVGFVSISHSYKET